MADIIKLPRSALSDDLWRNGNLARLFLYLLSKADDPVSFRSAARETGLTLQEVRTAFGKLGKAGVITQVATQKTTQVATQVNICGIGNKAKPATQVATQKTTQVATQVRSGIFTPPTQEEVTQYCVTKGYHFNPEQFIPYYEKQGWKQANGLPLKDWKAGCRYWESRWKEKHGEQFYYQMNGTEQSNTGAASAKVSRDRMRSLATAIVSRSKNLVNLYNGQGADSDNRQN